MLASTFFYSFPKTSTGRLAEDISVQPEIVLSIYYTSISLPSEAIGARPEFGYASQWNPAMMMIEAVRKYGVNASARQ